MAAPVNANINVLVNTQQAMAQLRALQNQVTTLNNSIAATSGTAAAQQAALAKAFKDSANASRMWDARIVPMNTAVNQFTTALDKGRMSLGQYTRFAASQLPGMSRVFKREFEMMNRVAEENVRKMQTQYVALGNSATGAAQAMALTPTALDRQAASTAIATQRQMMMNRMIDLGTTKLLNWGKNTQWAGRQLMVGFSIPLAMMGAAAAKAFKEIDQGTISFKRVYGDLQTTTAEMERNLDAVKELGREYTRYGNSLAETIELAAAVAATGARNNDLTAATEQTLRLATLGLMENAEAMDAVVSLQTAFQISSEDLAESIDFLNVVENETILTMQDMAVAIPRVAPVVKGLGGDVKDLAVLMTALREGGVSAEQGANALKSGLGRLINPTKAAREEAEKYGISIDAIVQRNRGDLMGVITEFGNALATLGQLEQQQVLQKVFGTYQYARLGALFKNIANDAGQAQRTMELTAMSVEDLAKISERELSKIEEATSIKFQAAIEQLKISIAPIGEAFMKALIPVIDIASRVLDAFNNLPDGIKNAIAIAIAAIAGIGPIVLMTVGLIANGIANIGKLVQTMRKFFARLRGDSSAFDYLTQQEMEAVTAANALGGATDQLTGKFLGQRRALESLTAMVGRYAGALSAAASSAPAGFGIGVPGAIRTQTPGGTVITGPRTGGTIVTGPGGIRMARGGVVPGTGNKDTVPAMLTPGESVITKEATQKYGPMIQAMNAGTIPGFQRGVTSVASGYGDPQSSLAKLVFAHGQAPRDLTPEEVKRLKEIAKGSKYIQQATRMQGLSNFGFIAPESFNRGQMTGRQASRLFNDPRIVDRTMYPMYQAIARQLGQSDVSKIMNDPAIQSNVRGFARNIGRGLAVQATQKIDDPRFYQTVQSALAQSQLSPDIRGAIEGSRNITTVAAYGGGIREKGERVALGMGRQTEVFGATGGVSYKSTPMVKKAAMVLAGAFGSQMRQSLKIKSPSKDAEMIVTEYVDGLEVGAAKNAGDAAKAGKIVGNSFATSVKQSILTGKTAPGLIPGAAKMQYKQAQSDIRREAFNRKEMQRIGMTDAQITRQLERLKTSKEKQAQAQEKQAKLAQANARLAQTNANLAQQSSKQMAVEEQARRRGLRTRVSEYFATPVGDGTQTRGQAIRGRIGAAGGGATMGLMGLSMAASMAGGTVGEMAQKVMPVTMGLMGLQMILPMLTNPIGLAILAVGGLTAGFVYLRKQLDDTAKEAANLGANIGGVANGMKIIEEATGFAPPKLEDRLFRFTDEDRAAMTEFSSYFESEAGSKFIQELKEATSEERYQKVSRLLAQAVGSGLEPEKAKALGFAIAEATGDALLKSGIARDFANQVFKSGSEALISLEKQRMELAPEITSRIQGIDRLSAYQRTMPVVEGVDPNAITVTTEGYFQRILRSINVFKTFSDFFMGQAQEIEKINVSAEGLGFALQTIQNLTNAEAVLDEERRNGLITIEEYTKRSQELDTLQEQTADYLGEIFAIGSNAGAMAQALGDQLSFAGFSEDQITRITQRFNPEALTKQFFGDKATFDKLTEDQRSYVEQVLTRVLSGLTPENVDQRLEDVQGTYTAIAEEAIRALANGTMDALVGLDAFFNQKNIEDYIAQRMGGSFGFGSKQVLPQQLAQNIMKADSELKKIGTDSLEVFTRLTEFTDVDFAKGIMASEEKILAFGDAVAKLAEYEQIKLEVVMTGEYDPDQVVSAIEEINDMELNPRIFGAFTLNAESLVASFVNAGMEIDDLPQKLSAATNAIGMFGKKAVDAMGNIRPEIVPKVIANVLGDQVDSPQGIANALNSAFPDGLKTIDLAILLTLEGDEAALALLSNPQALAAARSGEKTFIETVRVDGETFRRERVVPTGLATVAPLLSGGAQDDQKEDRRGGETGGGTEELSWLEQLREEIKANLQLFVGDTASNVSSAMQQIQSKFKGMNIPVRILEMIGAGPEGLKRAKELLGLSKGQMKSFVEQFIRSTGAEAVQGLRVDIGKTVRQTTATRKLAGENEEVRSIILENDALTDVIATYKKSDPLYQKAIGQARRLAEEKRELAEASKTEAEKQKEASDAILESIQNQITQIEVDLTRAFEQTYGMLPAEMELEIRKREEIIRQIETQIDALNKLNAVDEGRIESLNRQKEMIARQIEAIERANEMDQRQIDSLRRQDEIRNRVSDALSKDLEQLSTAEDKIRESYQKRIDALDKVSRINDHIVNQQKQQLDLSRAISEGDIYAATAAAQQMRATSAEFAAGQARAGLEQGMENQIAGLRTAGGLTRSQAEQQIANIRQQSYQTSLLIRDIEDRIYQRNLELIPLKDQQYQLDLQIRDIQDIIYTRNLEIKNIQQQQVQPLIDQNTQQQLLLDKLNAEVDSQTGLLKARYDWYKLQEGLNESVRQQTENIAEWTKRGRDRAAELAGNWGSVASNAWNAASAIAAATGAQARQNAFAGGLIKKYAQGGMVNPLKYTSNEPPPAQKKAMGGIVFGPGSRDSVAAMLTPGEYVIRKAMVDKYGLPLMEALNQGSFTMPTYETGPITPEVGVITSNNISNVNAPVYNKYDMKFSINGTNQSADEIANKVMFKMKQIQSHNIRGNRGY